ncbi:MAG: hypothetical protein RI897_4525, partial [Verrucomicrobiota bacterium]
MTGAGIGGEEAVAMPQRQRPDQRSKGLDHAVGKQARRRRPRQRRQHDREQIDDDRDRHDTPQPPRPGRTDFHPATLPSRPLPSTNDSLPR